ncbi:MAG TPA: 2-C-methyl-D-erythritol 2,4-cyclodiphosphate synthase [Gammaproteobacteria bacterium]|nr:2-C-methyl-D-erythritol 2,4-cyclodiphosphate synthase [Gammaproteobacteria bacterium]
MRVGIGYDAHKLIPGEGMFLGGVFIKCEYALEAYSDGDVIIHALIDSLLGAAALGDIGSLFSSKDPKKQRHIK